ncbi:unnamed protein product, partial [Staurois parvus]
RSSTQKGKFRFKDRSLLPIKDWHLWGVEGSGYPNLTGTCSHFRSDRLGDRIPSGRCPPFLPPRSLLGHVTGPRRLQDHLGSAALLAHAQWIPGCEAASCHSRVPTLKMPVPRERRQSVK